MKAPRLYDLNGKKVSAEIIEAYHEKMQARTHRILDDTGNDLRNNIDATRLLRKIAHVACTPVVKK